MFKNFSPTPCNYTVQWAFHLNVFIRFLWKLLFYRHVLIQFNFVDINFALIVSEVSRHTPFYTDDSSFCN